MKYHIAQIRSMLYSIPLIDEAHLSSFSIPHDPRDWILRQNGPVLTILSVGLAAFNLIPLISQQSRSSLFFLFLLLSPLFISFFPTIFRNVN
jgi:hypothetical protein